MKKRMKLTNHARVRLEQRTELPPEYSSWKAYSDTAIKNGKRIQDLTEKQRNFYQWKHGKPNQRIPCFFDNKCFIFTKKKDKYILVTVFKYTLREGKK
jgi:hypothetical protein